MATKPSLNLEETRKYDSQEVERGGYLGAMTIYSINKVELESLPHGGTKLRSHRAGPRRYHGPHHGKPGNSRNVPKRQAFLYVHSPLLLPGVSSIANILWPSPAGGDLASAPG